MSVFSFTPNLWQLSNALCAICYVLCALHCCNSTL